MARWEESKHPRDEEGKFSEHRQNTKYDELIADDNFSNESKNSGEGFLKGNSESRESNFVSSKPKAYVSAMAAAKESNLQSKRWRVDMHDEKGYENDKLFVSEGGSCVAIEPDGNIISICKNQNGGERGVAKKLLDKAISEGGDRLDAFGEDLYTTYTKNGFEPVSWIPFDVEAAPKDWRPEYGKEPVIFYKYIGKQTQETFSDFLKHVQPFEGENAYELAKNQRDEEIKK